MLKKILNWLRISCAVCITTVASWRSVSKTPDRYEYDILAKRDKMFFNLNKISRIICVQLS